MFKYVLFLLLLCSGKVLASDGLDFGDILAFMMGIGISFVGICACFGCYARRRAMGFDALVTVEIIQDKMQREEKQLESALEAIIMRVNDLKSSIAAMIYKVEQEYEMLNWPTFLDNFALLSGQLTSLSKMLTHDKCPPLRNLTVLPLMLSQERDEELLRLTEHRVPAFAHDVVPDYLRSKPEPEVENKMIQLEHKAASLSFETTQKQLSAYSKVVGHVWEIVSKAREEWETEGGARGGSTTTSSVQDTHTLVAAVALGKGLKMMPQGVQPGSQGMMMAPMGRPGSGGPPGQPGPGPMNPNQQQQQMGKAPSGIKTNIKAAAQIHPYVR